MGAHGWFGAYPMFVVRWTGMMAAMMLPSLVPRLWNYARTATPRGPARGVGLAALAGVGYLLVWAALSAVVYPTRVAFGAAAAGLPALARATPMLVGAVVASAGALQFTAWKARHLACWRAPANDRRRFAPGGALRHGACLGVHCGSCGAGLTAVLLALGTMDMRVMAVASAAVALERLTPAGERVARVFGGVGVAAGIVMIAHGAYPGP